MKAHYAGSIDFDNDHGEWQDIVVQAPTYTDLCEKMKTLLERKKNSDVFFAAFIDDSGKEKDITSRVRGDIG